MSGHASQIRFSRLGQARGASPGSLDQRSEVMQSANADLGPEEEAVCVGVVPISLVRAAEEMEAQCNDATGAVSPKLVGHTGDVSVALRR